MRLVWATLGRLLADAPGILRFEAALDDGSDGVAIAYTALSGSCSTGDRVLLNTTAVELALGTGGAHFVVAHGAGEGVALDAPSGGHIMKLRYTPMQHDVVATESQESEHHAVMSEARSLDGQPVVCCGLHSQVPLVAAAIKQVSPRSKVAYCMTDQAALAGPLSDVVRAARESGLLDATITCGQAFGGDLEAVNLHSGLLAARHVCDADVTIAAIGPGVVGTATPFGHGGVFQGEYINAVASLGGRPIACLRVSFADARPRHRGVSHHTLAALTSIALAPAFVPVPSLPKEYSDAIDSALESAGVWERHTQVRAQAGRTAPPSLRGVKVTTMGRDLAQDPAFFAAAFAAGEIASSMSGPVL